MTQGSQHPFCFHFILELVLNQDDIYVPETRGDMIEGGHIRQTVPLMAKNPKTLKRLWVEEISDLGR